MEHETFHQKFEKTKRAFLDALFPIQCLGCGKEGKWACADCLGSIRLAPMYLCAGCGRAAAGGVTHPACRRLTPLDALVSPYHYASPLLRALIKEYKYHGAEEIGRVLAGLASSGGRALFTLIPSGSTVVAMPLHASRERWRGFNQTAVLGGVLSEVMNGKVSAPLVRVKRTQEQARLDASERGKNCRNAFKCAPVSGEIVLVDDVITSGSTLRAAAEAIKKAGAQRVTGFVLAHGRGDALAG